MIHLMSCPGHPTNECGNTHNNHEQPVATVIDKLLERRGHGDDNRKDKKGKHMCLWNDCSHVGSVRESIAELRFIRTTIEVAREHQKRRRSLD